MPGACILSSCAWACGRHRPLPGPAGSHSSPTADGGRRSRVWCLGEFSSQVAELETAQPVYPSSLWRELPEVLCPGPSLEAWGTPNPSSWSWPGLEFKVATTTADLIRHCQVLAPQTHLYSGTITYYLKSPKQFTIYEGVSVPSPWTR